MNVIDFKPDKAYELSMIEKLIAQKAMDEYGTKVRAAASVLRALVKDRDYGGTRSKEIDALVERMIEEGREQVTGEAIQDFVKHCGKFLK